MNVRFLQILGVLLAIAAIAMAATVVWVGMDSLAPPNLVDAELVLRSEGTTWTFTMDEPGAVMLLVDLPEDCRQDTRISISPLYVALRPDPVYEPSKEPEHVIAVPHDGLPSTRVELKRAGAYVVRMDPIPMAMGNEGVPSKARVRILRAK